METIADIVAEMRAKTAKSKDEAWYDKKKWEELCNRIKVAHQRELEDAIADTIVAAGKSASEVYEPHIQSEPVGNAAKIREALDAINRIDTRGLKRLLYELVEADIFDGGQINKTISSVDKAKAALAEPLRNCDVGTAEEQKARYEAFCKECQRITRDLPCDFDHECIFKWEQMPYNEESK